MIKIRVVRRKFRTTFCILRSESKEKQMPKGRKEFIMKGYAVADGYMGYVDGRYRLFVSEEEYYEFFDEDQEENETLAA